MYICILNTTSNTVFTNPSMSLIQANLLHIYATNMTKQEKNRCCLAMNTKAKIN